jgi:hypothetical protein
MTKPAKGGDAEAVLEFGAGHVMPSEDLFKLGVYPFFLISGLFMLLLVR